MRACSLSLRAGLGLGLLALTTLAGCGKSPVGPTPELTTETYTGTVKTGGSDFKTFVVNYALTSSDASVTVTAITSVATSTAIDTTIGVGFGNIAFDGSCTRAAAYTATAAKVSQELIASGAFGAGTYCVQVYDAGTLTEAINYAITVKHY